MIWLQDKWKHFFTVYILYCGNFRGSVMAVFRYDINIVIGMLARHGQRQ